MNEPDIKQLRDEVEALKKEVAAQRSHILLLLALMKTGSLTAHHANIRDAIRQVSEATVPALEANLVDDAKRLLEVYFS